MITKFKFEFRKFCQTADKSSSFQRLDSIITGRTIVLTRNQIKRVFIASIVWNVNFLATLHTLHIANECDIFFEN